MSAANRFYTAHQSRRAEQVAGMDHHRSLAQLAIGCLFVAALIVFLASIAA